MRVSKRRWAQVTPERATFKLNSEELTATEQVDMPCHGPMLIDDQGVL